MALATSFGIDRASTNSGAQQFATGNRLKPSAGRITTRLQYQPLLAVLVLSFSAGCGGGSGASLQPPPPPPPPDFSISFSSTSVSVAQGATSSPVTVSVNPLNNFSGSVEVTLAGLPSGVTSSPTSPFTLAPGRNVSLLFGASTSAATGSFTLSAQATSGSLFHSASLSLTVQSGIVSALPRTGYSATDALATMDDPPGEPHHRHITYDSANKHVFIANRAMNRVEVLSSTDGTRVAEISVPGASSADISADGKTIWIGTTTEEIVAIDPGTLQVRARYSLPPLQPLPNVTFDRPEEVLALSSGKLLVRLRKSSASEALLAFWDPVTKSLTNLTSAAPAVFQSGLGSMARSGDHTRVLVASNDSSGELALFDSNGALVAGPMTLGSGTILQAAASPDSSHFALAFSSNAATEILLMNSALASLGAYVTSSPLGLVFSRDGQNIYLSESKAGAPVITVLSGTDLHFIGEVPDAAVQGARSEIEEVDESQLLFGISNRGVTSLDAAHPAALPSSVPAFAAAPAAQPSEGPNVGGTVTTLGGTNFESSPQTKFGAQATSAAQSFGTSQIQVTSPASTVAGPVNITAYFPSGWLVLAPQSFSYGPSIREVLPNAGNKSGGDSISIYGFGFGSDPGKVTVTFGGAPAAVQKLENITVVGPSVGFDPNYPFPLERLTVQTPQGSPGQVDVALTSPAGSTTLPHGFQYLQSEQVYAKTGLYKFVLYDQRRQRVYLSSTDHVDVLDLSNGQFLAAIQPPGGPPPNAGLRGLALTPDDSQLVIADFGAQNVYLMNPDTASGTSVFVGGVPGFLNSGPARVAATSAQTVFVGLTGEGGSGGCSTCLGELDLTSNPVTIQTPPEPQVSLLTGAPLLQSDANGNRVFFSFESAPGGPLAEWDSSSPGQFALLQANSDPVDLAASADGNVLASRSGNPPQVRAADLTLTVAMAFSEIERIPNRTEVPGMALHPTGALLYEPFLMGSPPASPPFTSVQSGVDIVDTRTGRLRVRLMLPDPLAMLSTDTDGLHAGFLTVDENGQRIFAITASGLTVIQLASVPLSLGSVTPSSGPAAGGTTLTVRGSGFQSGITVTIGGKTATVTFKDVNTLTVATPALSTGPQQIVLTNPDGETYSLDSAFQAR